MLVDDAGADVGRLGPFGEPVDDEGVQMLGGSVSPVSMWRGLLSSLGR
jgi:hypothetical protein